MVWAEKVMGRSGHGPKWLWAEMTYEYCTGFMFLMQIMPTSHYLDFGAMLDRTGPIRIWGYMQLPLPEIPFLEMVVPWLLPIV